ncbi:MAG: phage terminase large subunit family protein [Desulfurococcales archaeon]|nr:phage terminase large subunit family protein [Desulfurococcales archaeon]
MDDHAVVKVCEREDAMTGNGRQVLCPRCRIPMEYMFETERYSDGSRRLVRYYRCPACGTKVIDEQAIVSNHNGVVRVTFENPRKIIANITQVRRRRR